MRRLGLYLILAPALLLVACCEREVTDEAVIEDTVRGYFTTFNAEDFDKCLTYFTDYEDREDALAFLSFIRSLSGPLELREIKDIAIVIAVPGGSPTATATVVFTILGEEGTDQIRLKKVNDKWKIIWEQEQEGATGESAAIEETVRDYFAAYNAEDFAKCLTYFTDFGDEQAAQASLSLMRDFIGEMTLQEVSYVTVSDQTATARVDFTFWWDDSSQEMQFRNENGVWKVVWAQGFLPPVPALLQGYLTGTVEVASEFQEVVEVKCCLLLADDGGQIQQWEQYQVRNTGDQPLHLCLTVELYNDEGELWGQSSFSCEPGPGGAEGAIFGTQYATGDTPAGYKVIVRRYEDCFW